MNDFCDFAFINNDNDAAYFGLPWPEENTIRYGGNTTKATNQALARFNGKLRKGSASLGITLAQMGKTAQGIEQRLRTVNQLAESAYHRHKRNAKKVYQLRRQREPLAGQVLEYEYGWKPFFDDIKAGMEVLSGDTDPPVIVKARGLDNHKDVLWNPNSFTETAREGEFFCTYAGSVRVTNPNLWLLNKLGVLNPVGILWDAIPWSFLVGMVVNVNQVIQSYTNEIGLEVSNRSFTRTFDSRTHTRIWNNARRDILWGENRITQRYKTREVGTIPKVEWMVKTPNLDWEGVLTMSALLVQRFKKLDNLIRVL